MTGSIAAIVADGTNFYATLRGTSPNQNGSVVRCPLTGCGNAPLVLAKGLAQTNLIAVDDTHVYWTSSTSGSIQRVAK